MSLLVMIASAPVIRLPNGKLRLDSKFVEGMRAHARHWDGPLKSIIWEGATSVPFAVELAPQELGFDLVVLGQGADLPSLEEAALVAAPADLAEVLKIADDDVPVVFAVEYTIGTRLQIVALDRGRGPVRKAWSALWNLRMERRRRQAFRKSAGLQCNGYPAFEDYAGFNSNPMIYLDGRMRQEMMARDADLAAKATYSGPLRIVHSGRLEPMKGAHDLLPIARALMRSGCAFTLDIFGTGSLAEEIRAGVSEFSGAVRLHDPVDFESELVPWMIRHADIFLSCHRQADPSCTYLESLGCGVPVVGYANRMWDRLASESRGGWVVPMGDHSALVSRLAALSQDRADLVDAARQGLGFAKAHDFDREFQRRMDHFAQCLAQSHRRTQG